MSDNIFRSVYPFKQFDFEKFVSGQFVLNSSLYVFGSSQTPTFSWHFLSLEAIGVTGRLVLSHWLLE